MEAVRAKSGPKGPQYSRERCLGMLIGAYMRHGAQGISGVDYDRLGLSPSSRTIIRRFGTWKRALSATGFDSPPKTGRPPKQFSSKEAA